VLFAVIIGLAETGGGRGGVAEMHVRWWIAFFAWTTFFFLVCVCVCVRVRVKFCFSSVSFFLCRPAITLHLHCTGDWDDEESGKGSPRFLLSPSEKFPRAEWRSLALSRTSCIYQKLIICSVWRLALVFVCLWKFSRLGHHPVFVFSSSSFSSSSFSSYYYIWLAASSLFVVVVVIVVAAAYEP